VRPRYPTWRTAIAVVASLDATSESPTGTGQGYRADIQALRAVAVGSVLLFHLWPQRLTGGFVGVDVFFAISGYLITSHLVGELEARGRIRLGRFWARRAKRLLPASLLVLLSVAIATMTLVPLSRRTDVFEELVGATFYVENWVLAGKSVDYLGAQEPPSPVQHFWTLSVEEQFYVALPLVLLVAALVAALARWSARRTVTIVLVVVTLASLAYSIHLSTAVPGAAYFSTGTRAWEFVCGGVLACLAPWLARRLAPRARMLLGAAGLAAISVAVVAFDGGTVFPGYAAALPVLGAAAVLAAADRGPVAWAGRWRPVTFVGDISYAVYLWHWPLIVVVPYVTGTPLDAGHKVAVAAATLVLAWLSTRFVENPVRFSPRLLGGGRRSSVVGLVCLAAMVVVAGVATSGSTAAENHQQDLLAEADELLRTVDLLCLGANAVDPPPDRKCRDLGDALVPAPSTAYLDDGNRKDCWAGNGVAEPQICSVGPDKGAARRVLAIGDSHSNMYIPSYEELAERLGWRVDITGKGGCSWTAREQLEASSTLREECQEWKAAIDDHLTAAGPYDVILTSSLQTGDPARREPGETSREATAAGYREAWLPQIERGTTVIAIQDTPLARSDVVECVEREGPAGARACLKPRDDAFAGVDSLRDAVAATPGSALIGFRDLMCGARACFPVIGNVVVYFNRDHVTATFARTLGPVLVDRVQEAISEARRGGPPA